MESKSRKLALAVTAATIFSLAAQPARVLPQAADHKHEVIKSDLNSCELNPSSLDVLASMAKDNDERVFIIARLGEGETSDRINQARLHSVRRAIVLPGRVGAERLVLAAGERVEGEGRVEFYLGSRLLFVSLAKRGRELCLSCCGDTLPKRIELRGRGRARSRG